MVGYSRAIPVRSKKVDIVDGTDFVAWYAAFVATAVLLWDIVKYYRSGPQISGEARAGMESYGIPDTEGKSLTTVRLTNTGDRPTTLLSWGFYYYPAGASLDDKESRQSFIVKGGLAGVGELPKKLGPGDIWDGVMLENGNYDQMLDDGTLMFGFGFSHTQQEVLIKIQPNR